jgi:hypothetical protein
MILVITASCSISAIWQAIWKAWVDAGVRGLSQSTRLTGSKRRSPPPFASPCPAPGSLPAPITTRTRWRRSMWSASALRLTPRLFARSLLSASPARSSSWM